jgi:hypothetical protein
VARKNIAKTRHAICTDYTLNDEYLKISDLGLRWAPLTGFLPTTTTGQLPRARPEPPLT